MMEISYINENYKESEALFICSDKRGWVYENIDFIPVSVRNPIIWKDKNTYSKAVFDITNSGDLSVTESIAKVFMSFDPYGVIVLPNKLDCLDGISSERRYIIAINNELDVVDTDKSIIKKSVTHYDREIHGYDVPIEEQKTFTKIKVNRLFVDSDKLMAYPKYRRHAFRVKGTNNFFFSSEIYEELYKISLKGLASGLIAFKFDTNEMAPKR